MAEINQFGSERPHSGIDAKACAQFESMLADAVDGVLSVADQAVFDEHARTCAGCGTMLAEAQRGAAWMEMLKAFPPEPPASLVQRILAETSVRTAAEQELLRAERRAHAERSSLLGGPLPAVSSATSESSPGVGAGAMVLPFRSRVAVRLRPMTHTVLQPRFMMTAAMAFFSIALTLNVAGLHLNQIRASDLRPSSLRRDFYQANAHVVRYYDNLRVVYELESRVHDLQRSSDESSPAAPEKPTSPEGKAPDRKGAPGDAPESGRGTGGARPGPRSDGSRRDRMPAAVSLVAYCDGGAGSLFHRLEVASREYPDAARRQPGRAL